MELAHRLVVGVKTLAESADEVGEAVDLSLSEMDPLIDEGSVLLGGTKEAGVGCESGN